MKLAEILPSPAAWRKLAPMLLLMAAVLWLFRGTAVAMVTIWDRSGTFAHAFLVPPIVVWLVWRRRETLARLQPRPAYWVLLPMAGVCVLWLLGELAGVNAATQLALVALLVLSVPAVFGIETARALTFPLLFLFFAVPIGEFMVPMMMEWTADFAAAAVRASGVPLYREGLQFVIPSGSWSVVEACSGVRYLIASFMVGTLFAYLNFQSAKRRLVFMAASLLVPIVANWVRAYMIVMIGHLSNNKLAAGVDHIIYGWLFFGLVIGVMFMIGARWAEPDPPLPAPLARSADDRTTAAKSTGKDVWGVGAAALLLLVMVQAAMWQLNRPHGQALPVLRLPQQVGGGWTARDQALTRWVPAYANAEINLSQNYQSARLDPPGTAQVGVWLAYYRDQGYDRKMVTSSNNLVEMESTADWAQTAGGRRTLELGSSTLSVRTAELRGSAEPGSPSAQRLRVWMVYWIGGEWTTSDVRARLQLAYNRLAGKGDDAAVLFFYSPIVASSGIDGTDKALQDFVKAALPALQSTLAAGKTGR